MANGIVQVPPDSTGKKIDAASLDVGVDSVIRQRIVIGDNSATAQFATVTGGALLVTPSGAINISAMPTVTVTGGVAVSGTAIVAYASPPTINNVSATVVVSGIVNLSLTANVVIGQGVSNIGGVSLVAGTANIGFINNISAPVQLAAGAANIGYINHISATVIATLIAGTANIGAVSLAAGTSNIGFINNISATVNVAFATPQTVNNISATVVTGLSYVIEKTTNSQVQIGDSANAAIRVNIVAGAVGGSGGTSTTDGVSFDAQVSSFTPIGGYFDDVGSGTLSENDCGIVRMTTNRAFHTNMRTDGGVKMDDSANSALRVNVVAGSSGGPSTNDNTTYSTGVTPTAPSGFIHFSASATTMTEGRVGAARITAERGVHINLRNNAGTEVGTAAAPISVKVETVSATATVVNAAGTSNIGGVSLVAGTANIGFINGISATVNVAFAGGISLASGTANIGFINNISATVNTVVGAGTSNIGGVSLVAGTANIGFINNISATVNTVVGAGTALIGGVSLVAGTANIGFINNISATVSVVIAAGTANIGTLNNISATLNIMVCGFKDNSGQIAQIIDSANVAMRVVGVGANGSFNISSFVDAGGTSKNVVDSTNVSLRVTIANATATVTVTTANPWVVNIPSASHGPVMVQRSTSATATLIAAPGAGLHIYLTSLAVSNAGTVLTSAQVGWSASGALITMVAGANGGGFVMNFDPPWKVASNEAVLCRVDPNSSGNVYFNANFFVSS